MKELISGIFKLTTYKVITYLLAGSTGLYFAVNYMGNNKSENESTEKVMEEVASLEAPNQKRQKRSPSSNYNPDQDSRPSLQREAPKITKINKSNFIPTENKNTVVVNNPETNDQNTYTNTQENNSGTSAPAPSSGLVTYSPPEETLTPASREEASSPTPGKSGSDGNQSIVAAGRAIASTTTTPSVKKAAATDKKSETENTNSSSGSSNTPATNTCTSNIISGAFGNPIGVTINCDYASQIKYCLSKDTCCDPDSQGTDYTSYIVIGAKDGNYCLSYYGNSTLAGSSALVQQNYTINSTLPNLTVGNPKTYFQTTELNANSYITSLDFGKENHSVGQVNMKSHDPGTSGLNYDCSEIAENDLSALSPAPIDLLSLFDVSLAAPNSQIEIPLRPSELSYGENFVTSFIKNNAYVSPLYSCATSVITLDDFDYFQVDNAQGLAGDNSVREFEGGFTSYGFFEDNASVYRGPAGASSEDQSGSSLKSGLFSIFY